MCVKFSKIQVLHTDDEKHFIKHQTFKIIIYLMD